MARALWLLATASVAIALVACLWFVIRTLPVRVPYWGEAEVVFEASRLRLHQPLWIDPLVGTTEYGAPPSRFYVTYPPVFTWLVSFVPAGAALVASRVVSTLAWFGALAAVSWRRRESAFAAAFVAGIWVLANFATIGRPDSLAAAVAALALWRATDPKKKGISLGPLTIALFVLVPWIKPTMIGLPIGALLASRDRRAIGIAAGLAVASAVVGHVTSGGELFLHVIRSNAQPFTLTAWLDQVPTRLPFFAPLFAWSLYVARKERIAFGALAGAIGWTLIALAKTGSSSNYWMEPCLASVVALARAPRANYMQPRLAAAALVAVLWADVASIRGSLEHAAQYRADAARVAGFAAQCTEVASDEAGIELAIDRRILVPTYQMAWLVRRGDFPANPWVRDLADVPCYVEHTGQLELVPALAAARASLFVPGDRTGGYRLWKRR